MYERTYIPLALSFDTNIKTNYRSKVAINPSGGWQLLLVVKM